MDIEKIWLIRNKGQPFPAGKGSWEVIHFAEEYWTKRAEACSGRLDAYMTNLALSTNQLIQFIGLYIVFQGVLLTALDIIAARLTCRSYRFPLTLDIIATLCAVLGVALKFKEIRDFEKLEFDFNQEHKVIFDPYTRSGENSLILTNERYLYFLFTFALEKAN